MSTAPTRQPFLRQHSVLYLSSVGRCDWNGAINRTHTVPQYCLSVIQQRAWPGVYLLQRENTTLWERWNLPSSLRISDLEEKTCLITSASSNPVRTKRPISKFWREAALRSPFALSDVQLQTSHFICFSLFGEPDYQKNYCHWSLDSF